MSDPEKKPVINAELKARFKDKSIWMHLLHLVLYGLAFMICSWILLGVVILHFILRLLTGEPNVELQRFGQSMSTYLYEIVRYASFISLKTPFPLSAWPSGEIKADPAEPSAASEDE